MLGFFLGMVIGCIIGGVIGAFWMAALYAGERADARQPCVGRK
jgi:hypothetical protein